MSGILPGYLGMPGITMAKSLMGLQDSMLEKGQRCVQKLRAEEQRSQEDQMIRTVVTTQQ